MSTRAPRPVRPRQPTVTEKPVVETPPVVEPTPVVVEPAATPVAQDSGYKKHPRPQVGINPARVRRHLDKMNLNKVVDAAIADLKAELEKASEEAKPVLTAKIDAYSRERTRFANNTAVVLAVIANEVVAELTSHAMIAAKDVKKKIIQVEHLHSSGVDGLSLYPLFRSLPSFVQMREKFAQEASAAAGKASVDAAVSAAEKEFKKKYAKELKGVKKQAAEKPVEKPAEAPAEPAAEPEDDDANNKSNFKHYVGFVCKELVSGDETLRVSGKFKSYLSDLVVELIQRFASLVQLTTDCMKNKTINHHAILKTAEMLLVDGCERVETVELLPSDKPEDHGWSVTRSVSYTSCSFSALEAKVLQKLQEWKDEPVADKPAE